MDARLAELVRAGRVRPPRSALRDDFFDTRARSGNVLRARGLDELSRHFAEVAPGEEVREHASLLLRRHPLRAADALQLGSALVVYGVPASGEIVTFDRRPRAAARLEGLTSVPELS